jgi:hypothetical protein
LVVEILGKREIALAPHDLLVDEPRLPTVMCRASSDVNIAAIRAVLMATHETSENVETLARQIPWKVRGPDHDLAIAVFVSDCGGAAV